MNPLLPSISKSRIPSAPDSAAVSEAVSLLEQRLANRAATSGSHSGEGTIGSKHIKKLDSSRISRNVVMAQQLSAKEKEDLHFVLQRYRLLGNRLVEAAKNLNGQVFLITSSLAQEGKTLTSANLAYVLSGIEHKRTLIVDLDLRRFSLHALFGLDHSSEGMHFLEAGNWRNALWALRPNLHALISTKAAECPDELLHSATLVNILDEARKEYDYILIDSAPLLLAADTHTLLPLVDQAMLVVRADHTPIACTQDALRALGDKVIGCILNDVKRMKYESYYHSYYGTEDKA